MTDTSQAVGRSLSADIATLDTISHNVANINTPGYRAERTVPSFQAQVEAGQGSAPAGARRIAIDLRDGPLTDTGRPLDLALRGRGFFVVERDGATVLSRAGNFRLDAQGQLVNAHGDRVLGESGPLSLAGTKVRIDHQGQIWQGETAVGRVQVVDVADPAALAVLDGGGYRYTGELAPWQGSVQQGAIEHANVDAAVESIRLLELSRHVESVQRAISIYDQAVGAGISRLGDN
jgi:flagellar basal body rod protein FlgG